MNRGFFVLGKQDHVAAHAFHLQFVSQRLRPIERALPVITAALTAGVDSVQLRDEEASITAALKALRADQMLDRARLVVNGHPKVAGSYGMPWLHLPASWLQNTPPFGRFRRVGLSVHSFDEAVEADALGVDYVTFGHVFATASHPDQRPRGLDALASIVDRLSIPVLAIGGITHSNIHQVLETGCAGVVVMSAIADQTNPGLATTRLIELIAESPATPKHTFPALPTGKVTQ